MRILQLVAGDRWTGGAATALQLAEALRGAGVECHFAYRPGRNLEQRLAGLDWCHSILAKERSLADIRTAVARVRELAAGFDVVHVHLSHDHFLARAALQPFHRATGKPGFTPGERDGPEEASSADRREAYRKAPLLVRSVHHPKHLRPHPFHRWLFSDVAGVGLANTTMLPLCRRIPALHGKPVVLLPVALEPRFAPNGAGPATRHRLAVPADAFVAGTIGKLDRGRGHDLFIHALAGAPGVWGMIIGKGSHVPALQKLAARLGVAGRLVFPGYVEAGLEELYAAMDVFVFPAAGSDHAHRAIAEAAACGVPALAADLPGVTDLVESGVTGETYPAADAAALAVLLRRCAAACDGCHNAGAAAVSRAHGLWTPARLATAALELYGRAHGAQLVE